MIPLPDDLQTHLESDTTTVCLCWILRRRDGTVFGFTEHDRKLNVDGVECEPESGFNAARVEAETGFSVDSSEVQGALDSERITERDVRDGLYDGAQIETYLVNWAAPDQKVRLRTQTVGEISYSGSTIRLELLSAADRFDRENGRYFMAQCDAELGDARCGIDLAQDQYRTIATVAQTAEQGAKSIRLSGIAEREPGWFDHGHLVPAQPAGNFRLAVQRARFQTETSIWIAELREPLRDALPSGIALALVTGCDKRFVTCRDKFANGASFRGFPHMPGNDRALTYAAPEVDHDGSPLVP